MLANNLRRLSPTLVLTAALLAPQARADDLDVDGARRRYEAQAAVAAQAEAALTREQSRLDTLAGQLDGAQRAAADAQERLTYSQRQLEDRKSVV